jgi:hypothetical protein
MMKVYTVVLLLGDLPYVRYCTFRTKQEAVDYVWGEYNALAKASDKDKVVVQSSLELYADQDDYDEWNPWYSGTDFRMHIKTTQI